MATDEGGGRNGVEKTLLPSYVETTEGESGTKKKFPCSLFYTHFYEIFNISTICSHFFIIIIVTK